MPDIQPLKNSRQNCIYLMPLKEYHLQWVFSNIQLSLPLHQFLLQSDAMLSDYCFLWKKAWVDANSTCVSRKVNSKNKKRSPLRFGICGNTFQSNEHVGQLQLRALGDVSIWAISINIWLQCKFVTFVTGIFFIFCKISFKCQRCRMFYCTVVQVMKCCLFGLVMLMSEK